MKIGKKLTMKMPKMLDLQVCIIYLNTLFDNLTFHRFTTNSMRILFIYLSFLMTAFSQKSISHFGIFTTQKSKNMVKKFVKKNGDDFLEFSFPISQ